MPILHRLCSCAYDRPSVQRAELAAKAHECAPPPPLSSGCASVLHLARPPGWPLQPSFVTHAGWHVRMPRLLRVRRQPAQHSRHVQLISTNMLHPSAVCASDTDVRNSCSNMQASSHRKMLTIALHTHQVLQLERMQSVPCRYTHARGCLLRPVRAPRQLIRPLA